MKLQSDGIRQIVKKLKVSEAAGAGSVHLNPSKALLIRLTSSVGGSHLTPLPHLFPGSGSQR
jgi:hypothetical protein